MFKFVVVILAVVASVAAKPAWINAPLAYAAPSAALVAAAPAPFVTATSSQVIARNYNGIATAPVVAPVAAYSAPIATAFSSPVVASAYSTPLVGRYAAAAPLGYASPLTYAAHPAPVLF